MRPIWEFVALIIMSSVAFSLATIAPDGSILAGCAFMIAAISLLFAAQAGNVAVRVLFAKDHRKPLRFLKPGDGVVAPGLTFPDAVSGNAESMSELINAEMNGLQPDVIEILTLSDTGWNLESTIAVQSHSKRYARLQYLNAEDRTLTELRLHYYVPGDSFPRFVQLYDPQYVKEESRISRDSITAFRGETVEANGERGVKLWKLYRSF